MKKNQTKKAVSVVVLDDEQLNHASQIVDMIADANQFNRKKDDLIHASAKKFAYVMGTEPTKELWESFAKEIENSLIAGKKISPKTAKAYLTEIFKICKVAYELEKPKSQSKSAISMSKTRKELAEKSRETLERELESYAKAFDFTKAKQVQSEIKRRNKVAEREQAKEENSNTKELKATLKKWITGLNPNELATLVYVKENFTNIEKLIK